MLLGEKACSDLGELTFDTVCSRSVQGTLRLMIGDLEAYNFDCASVIDLAPYSLSAHLYDRSCRVKEMKDTECLWPRKEMQTLLEQLS